MLFSWILWLSLYQCVVVMFHNPGTYALTNRHSHWTRFLDDQMYHVMDRSKYSPTNSLSPNYDTSVLKRDSPQMRLAKIDPSPPFGESDSDSLPSRQYKSRNVDYQDPGTMNVNEICVAPDSRKGVCYDASNCMERGGIPMGHCGQGKGLVCCLFEATCGQMINEKHVYFRNPGFPQSIDSAQICRAKVNKMHQSICQLKLTFNTFDIGKPVEGNCTQDMFSVSGQNENNIIPRICGYNTGQHYYISVDESGLVNLQMMFRESYARRFDIHIEQLECDSKDIAPPYCLQYFANTQGTIKSFNYDTEDLNRDLMNSNEGYPNNIDYLICIRKETSFCSISYELMSDTSGAIFPFSVGFGANPGRRGSSNLMLGGYSRNIYSTVQSSDCDDDYLIVGGMRLCTKIVPNYVDNEAITSSGSSPPPPPSPTVDINNETDMIPKNDSSDTIHRETGELYEHIGEVSEVELHRPHRRANLDTNLYYGRGERRPMRPTNRHTVNKRSNTSPLMATDWTPGPFQIRFVANGAKNARGFYLAYRQNPCRH